MRIRTFILTASAVVSLAFFGGTYLAVSRVFDHSVKESAIKNSQTLADLTFNSMFQVMSTGWRRRQVEAFIDATQEATRDTPTTIRIFRNRPVIEQFGEIEQPPLDAVLTQVLATGTRQSFVLDSGVRYVIPLIAQERCMRCHDHVDVGTVMGAIEVSQDFTPMLAKARREFLVLLGLIAPLAMLVAGLVVWRVNRRIEQSIGVVDASIERVNAVADLKHLELRGHDLGFNELNRLFGRIGELVTKLRHVAVDKDILKFEIELLEKFVITSEVVKDWREYVAKLLVDINRVMVTHVLFSVFKIDDELFDLEIFWRYEPTASTREMVERVVHAAMVDHPQGSELTTVNIRHHVAEPGRKLELTEDEVRLRVKTFLVDVPKIGGIVGIGVHTDALEDETLHLVMDSVLSTLLNVVGSVKAIYKYTRDLEYYATRDPLTDLFNQRVFWEMLNYEVLRAQRHDYKFSVLVIDLDNFKLVNDSYGHAFGDRYLQQFALAVKQVLRVGDIFARYGGDEFVLVLPESGLEQGAMVAERILNAAAEMELEAPDGATVRGTVSIGMSVYPEHAADAKDLFLFADNMMYKAKSEGKRRIGIPTDEDVVHVFRDMSQKGVLVINAVENRKIIPFFQPILDIKKGEIAAFEVLSRIETDSGLLGAAEFIEIAERMGVIHKVDHLVIERALDELHGAAFGGQVFINLSPRAIVLNEFSRNVRRIVADSGISPEQIVFEITERDTVKNISLLERFLHDLKFEGFKLAIDDFGSGFSSFHYLRRFPIDFLKVEGDFIVNMVDNQKDRAFVQTMHALAEKLGLRVIAEYVENETVLEEVRRTGIDFAQGYYIGRPAREPAESGLWLPAGG